MLVVSAFDGPATLGVLDCVLKLIVCLRYDCSPQLLTEQHVERRSQLARDRVVIADEQALEEREIELPSHPAGCVAVGSLAVSNPRQGAFEVRLGCLEVGGNLSQPSLDGFDCRSDPVLLALEQIERHGSGVVGIEQRLSLVLELAESALLCPVFAVGVETELGEFFAEEGSQCGKLAFGELHGRVVRRYGVLSLIDADGSLLAARLVALASRADEVRIGAAVAFGVADDQPATAPAAVDAALEVVGMLAFLLPGQVLGGQQLLYSPERLGRDKRLVLAGVDGAPVAHHADVVGIAQQLVQVGHDQRFAGAARTGHCRQSSRRQLGQQTADRPLAGRVCLERPRHQRPALRVNLHGARFSAVDDLAHIQVADGRAARRPAVLGLLDSALDDLIGEVARVELGNRTHDAVQQQTGWRLVDVLADAHQLGSGLPDRHVDRHVIGSVARQSIDLVDDDVLDVMLSDVGQHALQLRPVGSLGRLAALYELFNHGRAEVDSLALAALTLGGNRVALSLAALLGLLLARHPQVDHRWDALQLRLSSATHPPITFIPLTQRQLHSVVKCTTLLLKIKCELMRLPRGEL